MFCQLIYLLVTLSNTVLAKFERNAEGSNYSTKTELVVKSNEVFKDLSIGILRNCLMLRVRVEAVAEAESYYTVTF